MASLQGFPGLPPRGEIALCELNGVCCMRKEFANISSFTNSTKHHPSINVTRDISTTRDEGVSMYLEVEDNLLKRLTSIWCKQGFVEALKVAAEPQNGIDNKLLMCTASYILRVATILTKIRHVFQPHLKDLGPKLTTRYSHTRDWTNSPVRYLAWHPHTSKIAVATADDNVRIYSSDSNLVPLLKCSSQKGVSMIAWRPYSVSEIAIGCEAGIIVWTVDPNSTFTKPSISNATILINPGHSPVTSISWSPSGEYLVSACAADYSLKVWNPSGGEPCTVRRVAGGGISHLTWSPDGSRLFAATTGIIFRVWDTTSWQAERWSVRGGCVQTAHWSPCSQVLLFATEEEPIVYALKFVNATLFAVDSNLPITAVPVIDLTRIEMVGGEVAGGRVLDLQWSPKGHHLAITFKDSSIVAVFNTNMQLTLQISPCCFIAGIDNEVPNAIAFQKNFDEGACLTIGWSSGRVQHFPFIYKVAQSENKSF